MSGLEEVAAGGLQLFVRREDGSTLTIEAPDDEDLTVSCLRRLIEVSWSCCRV